MTDTASPPTAPGSPGKARILDRRYQSYTGPRRGPAHATCRLTIHVIQRILGLRRPAKYKIVPLLLGIFCLLVPAGLVAVSALFPAINFRLEFGALYRIIQVPILLFVIIVGPSALVADRTTKSLSLYLASPLTRFTYLVAQAAAIVAVLLIATVGPGLIYLLGTVANGSGTDGIIGFGSLLGKVLLAGGFLSVYYSALAMAAGAFSARAGVAAGGIFVLLPVLDGLSAVLADRLESYIPQAFSIGQLPGALVDRVFNFMQGPDGIDRSFELATLDTPWIAISALGWIVIGFGACWARYQRMVVSR